jgi:hypothetical protein
MGVIQTIVDTPGGSSTITIHPVVAGMVQDNFVSVTDAPATVTNALIRAYPHASMVKGALLIDANRPG